MIPASQIRKNIGFNKNFRSLLEVLKLVAVSQYHILERELKVFDAFGQTLSEFFDSIDLSRVQHPFLDPGDRPMAVVTVTSDAGLLGGMNLQVVSCAADLVRESSGRLIVIGERGQVYAQDLKMPFVYFPGVVDSERHRQAAEIRDFLIEKILAGQIGAVRVVYPKAISLVFYRLETETLMPFVRKSETSRPAPDSAEPATAPIFESTPAEILEYLVFLYLGERFYEIFGMSRLAEQTARFVHLEESSQRIADTNKKLLLQYFRRRHEIIDQNMRELFAARSIYAK